MSPKELMEKLNLDMGSIHKIFDYKVSEIKNEIRFIKIANSLIKKEIIHTNEDIRNNASIGYQFESDPAKTELNIRANLTLAVLPEKDICDICELDLVTGLQSSRGPVRVYQHCHHTFHQHCTNSLIKEAKG